ncbi:MAG: NB-ARC domain-containing protein [Chloroflexota bacterium]
MSITKTTPPASLHKQIKDALTHWHKPNTGESPLDNLYIFREQLNETLHNHRRVTNDLLMRGIQALEREQSDCAAYLQQRYFDENSVAAISKMRNISQSVVFELQKVAIQWLATAIWDMERERFFERQNLMYQRLEAPTYLNLVGAKPHQDHLIEKISLPDGPYILSLTGIGGLGKTSMADSIVRRVIEEGQFDSIGWVTIREKVLTLMGEIHEISSKPDYPLDAAFIVRTLCSQLMPDFPVPTSYTYYQLVPILEQHLKNYPHFIVVDNLETLEDVNELIPLLQRLSNPSKFLLTSRENMHGHPNLYHYTLPPLSLENTLALVRQEAQQQNLDYIAEYEDEVLYPIYETVGGNPLALRLVVGLAHYERIEDILLDLKEANNETADKLYSYVYRQGWDKLSELDKQVFLTMSVIKDNGEEINMITANSGMTEREVRKGIRSLGQLNLVNIYGQAYNMRYSIHELTKSFLFEQVNLWMEEDDVQYDETGLMIVD